MSGAGFGEFARCWGLVNRARRFDPSRPGRHELLLALGNCEGFARSLRLTAEEFPEFRVSVSGGPDGDGEAVGGGAAGGDVAALPPAREAVTLAPGRPDGCSEARFAESVGRVRGALGGLMADAPLGEVARSAVAEAVKSSGGAMSNRLLTAALGALQAAGEVDVFEESAGGRRSHFVRAAAGWAGVSTQAAP